MQLNLMLQCSFIFIKSGKSNFQPQKGRISAQKGIIKKMKKFSKILMIVACLAMVFCFTAGVSASTDTDDSVTVKIYLQQLNRNNTPLSPSAFTGSPIEVTANENESLEAVIKRAVTNEGNLLTASAWHEVDVVAYNPETGNYEATGEKAQALDSLTYGGTTYLNVGSYNETYTSYTGTSWMWFYGAPAEMPALSINYPTDYLSQVTVGDLLTDENDTVYDFTLSYETETMTW